MEADDLDLDRKISARLEAINRRLPVGWEVKVNDDGRAHYIYRRPDIEEIEPKEPTINRVPPPDTWDTLTQLPYGWEAATDGEGKPYFINHLERRTTRSDPREDPNYVAPPSPRHVTIARDADSGFGFVAGSEKPVIIRFVTAGGPSADLLLPGDHILSINGEDVIKAAREYVINIVRSCTGEMEMIVCQPYCDDPNKKSSMISAAKRARLKKNTQRVTFAESVCINGENVPSPSTTDVNVPYLPNVLKVFLENGQTKSFKYDNKTTVKEVLNSLQEKLGFKCMEHFGLLLQNIKSSSLASASILHETDTLAEIAGRPGSQHYRCMLRTVFVPKDAYELLNKDSTAFDYYYLQCVNDLVQERFGPGLKPDLAIKLSALNMLQVALGAGMTNKFTVKNIE